MKIRVIDLETTGMPEDQVRGICEIGWADLPPDYLSWIVNKSDLGADEKHTARHHLGAR